MITEPLTNLWPHLAVLLSFYEIVDKVLLFTKQINTHYVQE